MAADENCEIFMRAAMREAEIAGGENEVPIGAVIVRKGQILATGRNRRETDGSAIAHAETLAIAQACRVLGTWRLTGCELYVTLEPCPMCAGAIINSRIQTVVFGARDPKAGACGSVIDLFACPFNHRPKVVSGVLEDECAALLKNSFAALRER